MNVYRVLRVRDGDIVNRLRNFLSVLWSRIELEAILAPVVFPGENEVAPQAIEDPGGLSGLNPFAPIMLCNTASAVSEFVKNHSKGPLAVMLRPCELRTLIELQKQHHILSPALASNTQDGWFLTIGLDCPGTLAADEFARQVKTLGIDTITRKALAFGAESGFLLQELRKACQLCDWPTPIGADLTIGIFGALSRQSLLVIAKDHPTDTYLELANSTDGLATEAETSLRETALMSIFKERAAWRDSLNTSEHSQPGNIDSLLACLARCTLCADCLDACPIYDGELCGMLGVGSIHQRERPLLAELIGVSRWLASCSGCGMCEEVCEWDIPLTLLISLLNQRIHMGVKFTGGKGWHLPGFTPEIAEKKV